MDVSSDRRGRREIINQQIKTKVSGLSHCLPLLTSGNSLTKPCMFWLAVSFQEQDPGENTSHQGEPPKISRKIPLWEQERARQRTPFLLPWELKITEMGMGEGHVGAITDTNTLRLLISPGVCH